MSLFGRVSGVLALCALAGCTAGGRSSGGPLPQEEDPWFQLGEEALATAGSVPRIETQAKNVILFIGDGLDVATVTAARILEGQLRGEPGEENLLSFEHLPHRALLKTYNTNQQVADSAGAGTALLAGVKTKAGVIGFGQDAIRGDCASAQGKEVMSLFTLAQNAGLATGVVTTARITHATPAAAYGHSPERNWENDADVPEEARAAGCTDLALQLIESSTGSSLEIAFGGGREYFLPSDGDGEERGQRNDDRNLIAEWRQGHPGGSFVKTRDELLALDPTSHTHVLGLFDDDHMDFEADRDATEPSLTEMTSFALDVLSRSDDGYLLLVEGGRIDHAHHYDNAYRALTATVELAEAVEVAMHRTDPEDTLIIVTSDHGHTMTISGYPTRGNPILGLVVGNDESGRPQEAPTPASDGMPYTTLSYANGLSAPRTGPRADLSGVDTHDPGFQQPATVPLGMETHGGADVPSYARGPSAHLLSGTAEQNYVFHVIRRAAGL